MGRKPVAKALVFALWLFACALLAAFLLSQAVAFADDGEVGAEGGSVLPIWTTDIRMAAETVQATCFGSFAEYRVDFQFVNYGKARKVELGFPFASTVAGEHGTERPIGFQAWQNGRPLSVKAVEAGAKGNAQDSGYFLHEAVFPHGASMITVSYLANASGEAAQRRRVVNSHTPKQGMVGDYQYWLHTGSTWKGTIGKAVVRYSLADSFRGSDIELTATDANKYVPVTSPPGWTEPLPRMYQWQFSDFEPKPAHLSASDWWKPQSRFDITLGFTTHWPSGGPTKGPWTTSSSAARGGYTKSALQDGYPSTCWAEGVPGLGIRQWTQKRFKRPTRLRELRIVPGNNEYGTAFTKFARPRTLRAVFSDGSSTLLHFKDAPTLQRFPVDVTTRSVRLIIRSVYKGSDYPGTCISEVEFGTERAPGYAPFGRLISDPYATGRLSAWAGTSAPQPHYASGTSGYLETQDSEYYSGGNLIGIDDGRWFGRDAPPFAEPSSLAAIVARDPAVRLPKPDVVGEPTTISALSYRTFAIRYSSGVDLLVYTRPSRGRGASLLTDSAREARDTGPFTDNRKHPFKLVIEGPQVVVLARAGCSDYIGSFPNQVFWRAGNTSYHLYAQSKAVTTHRLLVVARSMVDPGSDSGPSGPTPGSSPWLRWFGLAAAAAAVAAMVVFLGLQQRRPGVPQPDTTSPGRTVAEQASRASLRPRGSGARR